ncbi:DsrE family protein [Flagellimonas algicola]|uniref:DsrE family protein n=1 Tax=Flagellimonas algicola TaxID=2583815 RepID=A0ABY2WNV1_9FLAO|nr:DsrE family protein [Allomuricauda algicola]TMU56668.1 DsrE family protein [Allomuricauda algicola]
MRFHLLALPLFVLFSCITNSQTAEAGPIITDFGKVYEVNNPDYKVQKDITFKAVIDVTGKADSHSSRNARIETAARFLNMHAQSGVPNNQLKVALVVHGGASKDVLSNVVYQKKYKKDNPNLELVKSLLEIDVPVIICGQSAAHNKIAKEDLIPGVQISLSAMTALVQLQNEGYQLIKF